MNKQNLRLAVAAGLGFATVALLAGCAAGSPKPETPVPLAGNVDLPRYMGAWYVIANIPTYPERNARDSIERYTMAADGNVDIDFSYRKQGGDGELKTMTSRGFVSPENKAVWGVQFVWPIKADYRIAHVNADYTQTIVARDKRDYVWIMARTPSISEADYQALLRQVGSMGYDVALVQKVPQGAPR